MVDVDGDVALEVVLLLHLLAGLAGGFILQRHLQLESEEVIDGGYFAAQRLQDGAPALLRVLLGVHAALANLRELREELAEQREEAKGRHRGAGGFDLVEEIFGCVGEGGASAGRGRGGRGTAARRGGPLVEDGAELGHGVEALDRRVHVARVAEVGEPRGEVHHGGRLLFVFGQVFHEGDLFFGSLDDARGAPHHHELLLLGREVFKAAIAELDVVGELFAALESHDLDPLGGHAGEGEQLCLEV